MYERMSHHDVTTQKALSLHVRFFILLHPSAIGSISKINGTMSVAEAEEKKA